MLLELQPTLPSVLHDSRTDVSVLNCKQTLETRGGIWVCPTTNTKGPSQFFVSRILFGHSGAKPDPVDLLFHQWCLSAASPASLPQRSVSSLIKAVNERRALSKLSYRGAVFLIDVTVKLQRRTLF